MGYERTSNDPQSSRQRKHRTSTPTDRIKMRQLRQAGTGVEEIARIMGFSLSVVHRWTKDVPVPRKAQPRRQITTDRAITKLERAQRRATDEIDAAYSTGPLPLATVYSPPPKLGWPFHFNPDAQYDTAGPYLDPDLINHAESILEQWVEGTAKGRMYERRINVNQATLIYASSIPLWDYESFLERREMWKAVRALAGINSTELAARLDISPASISRYEKKDRNPPVLLMKDIHRAYVQLLETAINKAEWTLTIDSWADTVIAETGTPYDELTGQLDEVHAWVAQGTDVEDFTIAHIEHLAAVRRWLPYPEWREATPANLWLVGYSKTLAVQPV